jgi:hypothetical protein
MMAGGTGFRALRYLLEDAVSREMGVAEVRRTQDECDRTLGFVAYYTTFNVAILDVGREKHSKASKRGLVVASECTNTVANTLKRSYDLPEYLHSAASLPNRNFAQNPRFLISLHPDLERPFMILLPA